MFFYVRIIISNCTMYVYISVHCTCTLYILRNIPIPIYLNFIISLNQYDFHIIYNGTNKREINCFPIIKVNYYCQEIIDNIFHE